MSIYRQGFETRRFKLEELANKGNLQTLARFRDKIKAQQIYLTGLKYNNPDVSVRDIDENYIDELTTAIIGVLKDFYVRYKDIVKDIIIEVGETNSFLAIPSNSFTDGSTVVLGILAPEVVAHELGHVVDMAKNPGKMGTAVLSRLASFGVHMLGPATAGLAARKGDLKTTLAVPIAQAGASALAAYLIGKREDAATKIATDVSSYVQNTPRAQQSLKDARITYSMKRALLNDLIPGLLGTSAAVGAGLALRAKAKADTKKFWFRDDKDSELTPEESFAESFLVGPAGSLGYGLGKVLLSREGDASFNTLYRTTTDPLHKKRKESSSFNVFDIMNIKNPRRFRYENF